MQDGELHILIMLWASDDEPSCSMAGRIILSVAYGIEPNANYIRTVYYAVQGLGLGLSPRALLHDMFPVCEYSL